MKMIDYIVDKHCIDIDSAILKTAKVRLSSINVIFSCFSSNCQYSEKKSLKSHHLGRKDATFSNFLPLEGKKIAGAFFFSLV